MFVKVIETLPALAVNELVLYFNWPSAFAARLSDCPAAPVAAAGVEEAAELEVVGAGAEELVVLDELPQPASAIRPAVRASTETLRKNCDFARAAA
jgi:hypothetical protein